jgi:O-antigen/teichoic acid export membrane protein
LIDFRRWRLILKNSTIFLLISLLANLYFKLDVFLLNFLKGATAVGLYSSGYKFLEASLIVASSYNVSSLPILSRLQKENKCAFKNKIKKDLLFVTAIGLIIAFFFYFLAPVFLPLFLPGTYWQSIKVLQIVIVALPFILATSVFLNSLYAMGKAHLVVFVFIFQSLFNFSLNYLFIPKYSYFASAYITVIGEILNTIITFIFLVNLLGGKHENQR